jgi:hypothetical protein
MLVSNISSATMCVVHALSTQKATVPSSWLTDHSYCYANNIKPSDNSSQQYWKPEITLKVT